MPPPASSPASAEARHWLFGCGAVADDPARARIVSVQADAHGQARVWRRLADGSVACEEHRYPTWFLATTLEPLEHLPIRWAPRETVRHLMHGGAADQSGVGDREETPPVRGLLAPDPADHAAREGHRESRTVRDPPPDAAAYPPSDAGSLVVVALEGGGPGAFRYLVLAPSLAELEPTLLEAWNKGRPPDEAGQSLSDLRDVLVLPPVEQFLLITGRTAFHGLPFQELRRLQFDLETTGLDEQRDRIFMVSLRDSTGWQACLDIASMSEAALIERFARLVQERDPDVLENHNIFAFDLRFLIRRAASLGVRLALGRDGSEPQPLPDTFRPGDRTERFTRYTVAGREVIDTLHAVKRHAAGTRDLRRHGLKEAARHFGVAHANREYVAGPEVWATFQQDPERVRRYAGHDVDEVDGLSRRLMPLPFGLARLVPRAYEQLASDLTPRALLDPLVLRAYLHEGHALPAPPAAAAHASPSRGAGGAQQLFVAGVVRNVLHLALVGLAPRIFASQPLPAPAADELGALRAILGEALRVADALPDGRGRPTADVPVPRRDQGNGNGNGQHMSGHRFPGASRPEAGGMDGGASAASSAPPAAPQAGGGAAGGARPAGSTDADADRDALGQALRRLAEGCRTYLASPGALLADPSLARALDQRVRAVMDQLQVMLEAAGATLVEVDGERLLVAVPDGWRAADEAALLDRLRGHVPAGAWLEVQGRYPALYAHAEGSHMRLDEQGVSIVGKAFAATRRERFGEAFVRAAAALVLRNDVPGVRRLFLETVARLRAHQVPVEELCVQVTLHKSPAEYRRAPHRHEPYEVLLATGVKGWRSGQRVRYFRDRGSVPRLVQEGDGTPPTEADVEHYVQRLRDAYCQPFAHAFRAEDFRRLFEVPSAQPTLFGEATEDDVARITTTTTTERATGSP